MLRFIKPSRRRRSKSNTSRGRVVRYNSSAPGRKVLHPSAALPRVSPRTRSQVSVDDFDLPIIQPTDLRAYNPQPAQNRPAYRFSGRPARVVATVNENPSQLLSRPRAVSLSGLSFSVPSSVSVCVSRGTRKEVLHATGKAGKIGQRKPRRTPNSSISC